MLECLNEGTDLAAHMEGSKIKAWKQNLFRKDLLTERGEITSLGKLLLQNISSAEAPRDIIKQVRKKVDDEFELWWKEYPSTDSFSFRERRFEGSRGLRQKKDDCRKKFNEILLEGEYSSEDLMTALRLEVRLKKDQSVKDSENKMKYMQNTLTYLNQRTFENFIELARAQKEKPSTNSSSNTVDI